MTEKNQKEAPEGTPEETPEKASDESKKELVEKIHKAADEFISKLAENKIPAVYLPTAIAMIYNRSAQLLKIPASAIVDESVERLMAFQDLKSIKQGKMPQNGTMNDLIDEPDKSKDKSIVKPAMPILTNEGIPIADESTWG